MALRDWILNSGRVASAIPAIVAIPDSTEARALAGIATIAIASGENKEIVEFIDIVAAESIDVDPWLKSCCICGGIEFVGAIYADVESFWCVTCQDVPDGWIKRRRVNSQKKALWIVKTPSVVDQQSGRHWSPGRPYSYEACGEPTGWQTGDTSRCPACEAGPDDPHLINTTQCGGGIPPYHKTTFLPCSAEALASFRIGYTWINNHLNELLSAGWTRAELFRRGRYRLPIGNWGAAWLSSWSDPEKEASIGTKGEIVFSFLTATGQARQTSWPNITNPLFKET